jgi:hypothetical protein
MEQKGEGKGEGGGVIIKLHYKQIMVFLIHPLKRESWIDSQQVKKDKKKRIQIFFSSIRSPPPTHLCSWMMMMMMMLLEEGVSSERHKRKGPKVSFHP